MTYLWRIAVDCPNDWIAVRDNETVTPTAFRKAMLFEGGYPAQFAIQKTKAAVQEQDYLPNSAMLPLVSKSVASRLQDIAGDSIQSVPAMIRCRDGATEFSLINPLKMIRAVDWEISKALYIPGTQQVIKFTQLALVPDALGDLNLARLDEFRSFVLTSDRVKSLFAGSMLCEFALPAEVRP